MDKKELSIVTELRQNSRMKLTDLSKKTGIPVSTLFDRIKHYEKKAGLHYTVLLDFEKMGYALKSIMMLKTKDKHREDVRTFLVDHKQCNTLQKINNGFDYMAEFFFKNILETEEVISHLSEKTKDLSSYYVIEKIKQEGFVPS